jgi:Glycosyl hydrolase family 26
MKLSMIKPRTPASGSGGRPTGRRAHRAEWHRLLLGALGAGGVGVLSWVVLFPAANVVPATDHISPPALSAHAAAGHRGQGEGQTYAPPSQTYAPPSTSPQGSLPAPTATGAAGAPTTASQAEPAPSAAPTASLAPSPGTSVTVPPDLFPTDSGALFTVPPAPFPTDSGTSSTVPPASPPAGPVTPAADALGLGFYDGESSPAGIETAATWLGSPTSVTYAQDFIDATDWSHISSPWQLPNWAGSPFTMVWGVPMLPCGAPSTQCATDVADYNLVATGGADGYYQTLAQNLVAAGFGSSYIRLGWEFNADWMGWGICNEDGSGLSSWANDFVPAFQNIVTSMRSVAGANFKFIWNPIDSSNASCPGASLENFYPGDSYVDAVALDAYDGIGAATSDADRWNDLLNGVNAGGWTAVTPAAINGQTFQGYGLNWLAAFGQEHGKQISLPEWGLVSSGADAGGGDDSYFMTQMAAWIKANASGPVIFWNYGDGTLTLDIPNYTNGDTPNATAVFKAAFGTGA